MLLHSLLTLPAYFSTWLLVLPYHAAAHTCWKKTPCSPVTTASFPGEWDANNFAPSSRTVAPSAIFNLDTGAKITSWPSTFTLRSDTSDVYLDFGKEVGGVITLEYEVLSVDGEGVLGLAFTEAKNWVGRCSDSSNGIYERPDGAIYTSFYSTGNYTYVMPDEYLRGGFRYMTLFVLGSGTTVTVKDVRLEISFQPTWSNLRAYQGYFHSSDDLLNKIWYSGAYTLQLNALAPSTGRTWPAPDTAWLNTGLLGPGNTINTDGGKRDRTVWPGDMGVATPASFYSTGDLESVRNSLQVLYDLQNDDGLLPFSGPPLSASGSDTYHMWTMIGTYNYGLYTGDVSFIKDNWLKYTKAMSFLASQFNAELDLLNITNYANDWGRFDSIEFLAAAQMLAYRTLITGAEMAAWVDPGGGLDATWLGAAESLRESIIANYWDEDMGAFKDNIDGFDLGLYPQDGNSLAVLFGVVNGTSAEAQSVSSQLTQNWVALGAECPELSGEVSPFISSFEIQAHLLAGQAQRALDLIRTSWGWYLNHENGTQSTMVEGYLTDSTFGYRHDAGYAETYSYTSHAHGWSTGPVTALTEHILGLSVTGRAGSAWRLAPQFGDLTSVEGGFTTSLGKFSARWTAQSGGGYLVEYEVPVGTVGEILLPVVAEVAEDRARRSSLKVSVDGQATKTSAVKIVEGSGARKLYALRSEGGRHRIEVG